MLDPPTIDSNWSPKSSNGLHCLLHKRPFIYLNHTAAVGYLSYRVTRNTDFEAGFPKWTGRKKKSFFCLLWLLGGPSSVRSRSGRVCLHKREKLLPPSSRILVLSHKVRSIRPSVGWSRHPGGGWTRLKWTTISVVGKCQGRRKRCLWPPAQKRQSEAKHCLTG